MVSAIVLNWNELHVVKATIERLLNEENVEVIVVDNGSIDGSAEYLLHTSKRPEFNRLQFALLNKNHGSSIARNVGIDMSKGEHIFLIDGDILYVPGTIPIYKQVLGHDSTYGCVGYNDHHRVQMTGTNGTYEIAEADAVMRTEFTVSEWFPMAWTQYGLFRGDLLRKLRFYAEGCFGEFGHGYEDDWLFHEMQEAGFRSIAINAPLYFHDAHYSLRMLKQMNLPDRGDERAKVFYERWGEGNGWRERMGSIPNGNRVPFGKITID